LHRYFEFTEVIIFVQPPKLITYGLCENPVVFLINTLIREHYGCEESLEQGEVLFVVADALSAEQDGQFLFQDGLVGAFVVVEQSDLLGFDDREGLLGELVLQVQEEAQLQVDGHQHEFVRETLSVPVHLVLVQVGQQEGSWVWGHEQGEGRREHGGGRGGRQAVGRQRQLLFQVGDQAHGGGYFRVLQEEGHVEGLSGVAYLFV